MSAAKVIKGAVTLDAHKPEEAAVAASNLLATVCDEVAGRMQAGDAVLFHGVVLSRHLGYLAAHLGPDNLLALLKINTNALQECAPEMCASLAAARGGIH